jgi:hypothetical protein
MSSTLEDDMQDIIDAHLAELMAAQEAQNDAIEEAQRVYSVAVGKSRDKLMAGIDERLRVWNGEPQPTLPSAAPAAKKVVGLHDIETDLSPSA